MQLDARTATEAAVVDADLCIVGAGPVGLSLAHALIDSGLQVVLLESGSSVHDPDVQQLNAGNSTGDPYDELRSSRLRGEGGTAGIWNTMVRGEIGAKYLPLDEIDFEPREWAPLTGWPFRRGVLDPYYRKAHLTCGLGAFDYRAATWTDHDHPLLDLNGSTLTTGVYQYGQASVFRGIIPRALSASPAVTIVHGATVTALVPDTRQRKIAAVQWRNPGGGSGMVRASRFVLAAGGIENARILLLHARASAGRGPANDWIGRGFMDHPIDASLELISRSPALGRASSFYVPHPVNGTPAVMGRIALSPELLRELRMPNASVRLVEEEEPRLLQSAAPRMAARRLVPFPAARRLIGQAIRRAAAAQNRFRGVRYQLLIDLEQLPHRENRIVLSGKVDPFGQPQAELQWRWREEDENRRVAVRSAIARELARAGIGRTTMNTSRPLNPNAHHHAGTTRMHADPDQGVVDENLRVHGEENLYVAGSSVFPTSGFANPTLTAIALALRLAEQLAGSA